MDIWARPALTWQGADGRASGGLSTEKEGEGSGASESEAWPASDLHPAQQAVCFAAVQ